MIGRRVTVVILAMLLVIGERIEAQDRSPAVAFVTPDDGSGEGQGVLMQGGRGCVIVTAGHVVNGARNISWTSEGVSGTGVVKIGVFDKVAGIDIGIVGSLDPLPMRCPAAPALGAIGDAVSGSGAEIFKAAPTGSRARIAASITSDAPALTLRPLFVDVDIQAKLSGAPVRVENVVVGVVSAVENSASRPVITVQRLDRLPPNALAWLGPPAVARATALKPFDETILPADIRQVVVAARKQREKAGDNAREARRVEAEADKAAAIGSGAGPLGDPYATFIDDSEVTEFSGMVKRTTSGLRASSYGISRVRKGDQLGKQYKCAFSFLKNGGCDSIGVIVFEDKQTYSRWEGPICPGNDFCGPGVLWFRSGERWWYDPTQSSAGVGELADTASKRQSRFEGMFGNGRWNGVGVYWDVETGTVSRVGIWRDGSFLSDRSAELAAPRK